MNGNNRPVRLKLDSEMKKDLMRRKKLLNEFDEYRKRVWINHDETSAQRHESFLLREMERRARGGRGEFTPQDTSNRDNADSIDIAEESPVFIGFNDAEMIQTRSTRINSKKRARKGCSTEGNYICEHGRRKSVDSSSTDSYFMILYLNARSLMNKFMCILDLADICRANITVISEIWCNDYK